MELSGAVGQSLLSVYSDFATHACQLFGSINQVLLSEILFIFLPKTCAFSKSKCKKKRKKNRTLVFKPNHDARRSARHDGQIEKKPWKRRSDQNEPMHQYVSADASQNIFTFVLVFDGVHGTLSCWYTLVEYHQRGTFMLLLASLHS